MEGEERRVCRGGSREVRVEVGKRKGRGRKRSGYITSFSTPLTFGVVGE